MTADEAYKATIKNRDKEFEHLKSVQDSLIESAIGQDCFEVLFLDSIDTSEEIYNRLVNHYKELGYNYIEHSDYFNKPKINWEM